MAHAHLALLGAFTFFGMGLIDYMVPQMARKPIYSRKLSEWTYWLLLTGFFGFFWALTLASFLQGQSWAQGQPEVNVLTMLRPHYIGRALFGGLIVFSTFVLTWNVVATIFTDTSSRTRADFRRAVSPQTGG